MAGLVPLSGITERKLKALEWVDPKRVLVNLRRVEERLPSKMDERVRRLRTNALKEWRESRYAALFAYGIAESVLKRPTLVAKVEDLDFDFIMRWDEEEADYFYPVQLKELPPEDLNPGVSLEDILGKLDKYSGTEDLSVVVLINRRTRFEYRPWESEQRPRIRELWYLGCTSQDQSKWFLYGNVLANAPLYYEFSYPVGEGDVAQHGVGADAPRAGVPSEAVCRGAPHNSTLAGSSWTPGCLTP